MYILPVSRLAQLETTIFGAPTSGPHERFASASDFAGRLVLFCCAAATAPTSIYPNLLLTAASPHSTPLLLIDALALALALVFVT